MTEGWQQTPEAGSVAGIRFMLWVARLFGRRLLHLMLVPVAGYFLLVRHESRHASRMFLRRALDRDPTLRELFGHFYTFARVIADRYFFLTNDTANIPIQVFGAARLQELVDQGRGGIALSAHVGSFEAARVLGTRLSNVVLRTVLDRKVNQNLVDGLEAVSPDFGQAIIDLDQPPATLALQIAESLGRGEWIGFLSDRCRQSDKTEVFEFFGQPARFPIGPVVIAGMFKVPLICVFPLYIDGGYEVHCEVISVAAEIPRATRKEAIREYLGSFVQALETQVRKKPQNWFNFFDFWGQ